MVDRTTEKLLTSEGADAFTSQEDDLSMDVLTSGRLSNRERLSTTPQYFAQRNSLVKRNINQEEEKKEEPLIMRKVSFKKRQKSSFSSSSFDTENSGG